MTGSPARSQERVGVSPSNWRSQSVIWFQLAGIGDVTEEDAEGARVMGSPAAAATKAAAIFVVFWLAGYIGLPRISHWTWPFVASWVAVLDIVLVFIVFKGDVRIT